MGIDPGKTGGLAVISSQGALLRAERFDNQDPLVVLASALHSYPSAVVTLEAVHAMPGQGVVSMFTFGVGVGQLQGYLRARGIVPSPVSPQAWQKVLPDGTGDSKALVRAFCEAAYTLDRFMFVGCRVPHQGAMDAAAMAEYGRRIHTGVLKPPVTRPKGNHLRPIKL